MLVDNGQDRKLAVPETTRDLIIGNLEERLDRIQAMPVTDPHQVHLTECCALRLARYYRRSGDQSNVLRVLQRIEEAAVALVEVGHPAVAFAWLEHAYAAYRDFNLLTQADNLSRKMSEVAAKVSAELKPIEVSVPVDREELNREFAPITATDLGAGLRWVAITFIPQKNHTIKQVQELATSAPLQSIFTTVKIDREGRPVARVGSVEQDLEGRVVAQMAQNMQFSSWFLREAFERLLGKFEPTAEDVLAWLYRSSLFDGRQRAILLRGIEAFLVRDWIAAISILIPQIESSLRRLTVGQGAAPYKYHRHGGYLLKNFEELIREPAAESSLGEDIIAYLRAMLTDQRGWNLRNDFCHGTAADGHFSSGVCDRVVHALLLFGLFAEDANSEIEQ